MLTLLTNLTQNLSVIFIFGNAMTKNNKNMTSRTTKTILFAGLIMTLMVPVTGINMAEAVNENASSVAQDKVYDKLPDILMERSEEKWLDQYESKSEFHKSRNAIKAYATDSHPDNEWNRIMVKENIHVDNFDTIIGKKGHGLELVSLFAAKEKLQGTYNPSDQVKKYHDWASAQYEIPNTVAAINERINEIVGDKKYIHLAKQAVKSYENMAEHGNVPHELIETDLDYWAQINAIAVCEKIVSCDVDGMKAVFGYPGYDVDPEMAKKFERNQGLVIETNDSYLDFFVPLAYAATKVDV